MKNNNCLLCGCEHLKFEVSGADYFLGNLDSEIFDIYYCENCRNAMTLPVLEELELAKFYPSEFEAYVEKRGFWAVLQRLIYNLDLNLIRSFSRKQISRCYEVGAGRGEFLSICKQKKILTFGSEPSPVGRANAMKYYGIELDSYYGDQIIFNETYDAVILRHVLEHVVKPTRCLESIFDHGLSRNGVLFLKVPRYDSWERKIFGKYWHGYDLPRHRFHFSSGGIKQLLEKIGYVDIIVRNDTVPSDVIRSLGYFMKHHKISHFFFGWIMKLPHFVLLPFFQCVVVLLSYLGSGRMIVLARKPG